MRLTGDIRDEVLVRAGVTTTVSGLYTDAVLGDWLDFAHKWAAGIHKWPFTEGRASTTYVSGTEEYNYFEGWHPDSIRYLEVGGKRIQKTGFSDYKSYREDSSSGTDKVWSDFGLIYFINPNAAVSGSITAYGQFTPADFDNTDYAVATTIFSGSAEEGNEAMVEEILSYAKRREKKLDEAQFHHARAMEILNTVWEKIRGEQFGYQTKNRSIWKRIDVLQGGTKDELIRRDQFY